MTKQSWSGGRAFPDGEKNHDGSCCDYRLDEEKVGNGTAGICNERLMSLYSVAIGVCDVNGRR